MYNGAVSRRVSGLLAAKINSICSPCDLLDELAGVRGVEFHTEVEGVDIRAWISFLDFQLFSDLLARVEPLL